MMLNIIKKISKVTGVQIFLVKARSIEITLLWGDITKKRNF